MPPMWQAFLPYPEQEMRLLAASADSVDIRDKFSAARAMRETEAACGYPAKKIRSYEWSKKA